MSGGGKSSEGMARSKEEGSRAETEQEDVVAVKARLSGQIGGEWRRGGEGCGGCGSF